MRPVRCLIGSFAELNCLTFVQSFFAEREVHNDTFGRDSVACRVLRCFWCEKGQRGLASTRGKNMPYDLHQKFQLTYGGHGEHPAGALNLLHVGAHVIEMCALYWTSGSGGILLVSPRKVTH
jgi:hypothetical protein